MDELSRLASAATWGRLHTFLAAYDAGSVARAAQLLHVTPPAVSAAVGALERALGVALFAKAGRGVVPTAAGDSFAGYARTLLGLLDEAGSAVGDPTAAALRVGAVATAAEHVLPGLTASFLASHPRVRLSLEVLARDELVDRARHRELDVVLGGRPPEGSGLRTHARRPNRLLVVTAPDGPADPRTGRWLLRGAGSGTREATLGLIARLDASAPTLTLGTSGAVLAAARHGLGLTLAHEDAVRDDLARGVLVVVAVPGTPVSRPWHLCTPADPTPAARLLLAHAVDRSRGEAAFTRATPRGGEARR